ncbi:MAG TPA: tetratricopeptide repeat protein [Bryobacteraceae bacterium]|nr:tetratricopeptide repeat protein [Bryobacteraceae bacterium]
MTERKRRSGLRGPDYRLAVEYASHAIRHSHLLLRVFAFAGILLFASQAPAQDRRAQFSEHARSAQAAIAANDAPAAKRELEAMLKIDPANVDAHANLGMIEFVQGEYREAAGHFETAISGSPSLAAARAFLGMCHLRLGQTEQGRKSIEEALPQVTDKTLRLQAGLELVRSYSESGLAAQAAPVLDRLAKLDPRNPQVLYAMYRLHADLSSAALRQLAEDDPDSAWVHEVLGQNYMAQERYAGAVREFRLAVERGPQLTGLHYQLGEALFAAERSEENRVLAEKEFLAELKMNPGDAGSLYQLGEIAIERSKLSEAKSLFSRAIALRPEMAEAHAGLGKVLDQEGDAAGAIRELEQAAQLAPNARTTHYKLAQLYRAQGRAADADRELALFRKLAEFERATQPKITPAQP